MSWRCGLCCVTHRARARARAACRQTVANRNNVPAGVRKGAGVRLLARFSTTRAYLVRGHYSGRQQGMQRQRVQRNRGCECVRGRCSHGSCRLADGDGDDGIDGGRGAAIHRRQRHRQRQRRQVQVSVYTARTCADRHTCSAAYERSNVPGSFQYNAAHGARGAHAVNVGDEEVERVAHTLHFACARAPTCTARGTMLQPQEQRGNSRVCVPGRAWAAAQRLAA